MSCGRRKVGAGLTCSKGCRAHRPGPRDRALEERILELLAARPQAATLDPAEVSDRPEERERVRRAARRLVASGQVVIRQGGRVVDPSTAKGPIAIGRGPGFVAPR